LNVGGSAISISKTSSPEFKGRTLPYLGPNQNFINVPGSRSALTTPALILDLDVFEANLANHARLCGEAGIRLRPHSKTHKCAEVARRQLAAGAVGVCCVTLHEAGVMIEAGISGVLITSPVVGAAKINRLTELSRKTDKLKLVADNPTNVADLSNTAERENTTLDVLVDIDVGLARTGIHATGEAVALAKIINEQPHLNYAGIQAYSGRVQHIEDYRERENEYGAQLDYLETVIKALADAGLKPEIISGGGTGTHAIDFARKIFTEQQSGSYIFMDVEYNDVKLVEKGPLPFATSLFMQCSVISNNADGFVTIDGGYKCFATDGPKPEVATESLPGASYDHFGDEHGKIILGEKCQKPVIGTSVTLITPHCDPTVNLHNYLHCVRGDKLVEIWPIDARGVL
jgi:3-hydroxy-D-aspartate aldolase